MRGIVIQAVVALLLVVMASPAAAGIYATDSTPEWPLPSPLLRLEPSPVPGVPPSFRLSPFQDLLRDLVSLPIPPPTDRQDTNIWRIRARQRVSELEAKHKQSGLSDEDRVNLGAWYLRLRRAEEAVQVLTPAAADRRNFMALANLAMASHMAGRLDRAISYQMQALQAWPRDILPGWGRGQLSWYRRVEKYYLILLQTRYQESLRPGGKEALDPLFPGVKYVGANGTFTPGELAFDQFAELPEDAVGIVQQMVLWLPQDNRLYWQLGELLNAFGRVIEAYQILNDLVDARRYSTAEDVRQHRAALLLASRATQELMSRLGPGDLELMLGLVQPRGFGAPILAGEAGWTLKVADARRRAGMGGPTNPQGNNFMEPETGKILGAETPQDLFPQWQTLVVGICVGAVVVILGQMQFRKGPRTQS